MLDIASWKPINFIKRCTVNDHSFAYLIIIALFLMSQKQIILGVLVGAVAYMWWKSTTTPNNNGGNGNGGNGPVIDPADPTTVINSQPDYPVSVAGCVYKPASTILTI